ncbi:unnamed protein product [Toxocara canis]|uniref:CIA30 domain-containing protein n=1 Tax=Toxocara canis TaxID=6265 RepID=A0A183UVU9_TOXCA|nr:unnamed protein product [Toxocara canis]
MPSFIQWTLNLRIGRVQSVHFTSGDPSEADGSPELTKIAGSENLQSVKRVAAPNQFTGAFRFSERLGPQLLKIKLA